jgi:hypothetical protein
MRPRAYMEQGRKGLLVALAFLVTLGGCFPQVVVTAAQANPVPLINEPLAPDAAAPGGPGFTLTVNGTGFVSGAVVNWSMGGVTTPLSTTFVSGLQLTAAVPASNIAAVGTASVTVSNPGVAAASNPEFFAVMNPNVSVGFSLSHTSTAAIPDGIVTADFNGDGRPDLAVVASNVVGEVYVFLGNGDGTFAPAVAYSTGGQYPQSVAVGDFNGDGKPDLAVANYNDGTECSVAILLGNGDGTFGGAANFVVGSALTQLVVADFNGDGKLDIATAQFVFVLLGNGDGTFQPAMFLDSSVEALTVGDFNGDGNVDLVGSGGTTGDVFFFAGNGNGTFQPPTSFPVGLLATDLSAAELSGGGALDIVTTGSSSSLSVLVGNGNGTFQPYVEYAAGSYPSSPVVGDFNGDGEPDVATVDSGSAAVSVLLGNGDGTFRPYLDFASGMEPGFLVAADFNGDGQLDLAALSFPVGTLSVLLQQGDISLSPATLTFPTQLIGASGVPQTVTLANGGSSSVPVVGIALTGANPHYFSETSTCGNELKAGAQCTITVTFTPRAQGTHSAFVTVRDQGPGGGPVLALSGTGNAAQLSPNGVNFGSIAVGATSSPQVITLTNLGPVSLSLGHASITTGAARNFTLVGNTCKQTLASGASCAMNVTFTPSKQGKRTSQLAIGNNGIGFMTTSYVSLTGTGTQ